MQAINLIFPELLNNSSKVVITTHQKPDGDAMGSSLGLYHFLLHFGHTVQVISPTNWASFIAWMPGCDAVIDYEKETAKSDARRVLIDHHQQPQVEMFAFGVSDTSKSSTAEMVYDFILSSGRADLIDQTIAQCLYAGVMTDTGSFRFPSTSADVHRMVAGLKDKGLQHSVVHEHLYDNFSESRLRFIGNTLLNRMQVFYEYNTALIAIPQADLIKYEIKTGDTEGLVNYPLSIEGIKFAAIIIDRGEERKCSFRSKGDFDVNTFARNHFDGGGHYNAAGGQSRETLENVVSKFIKTLPEYRDSLTTYSF
jgi:phosphoesterase RecJ-like protein